MIAIGKPFLELLIDIRMSLEEYLLLYCIVYDKREVLKTYSKTVSPLPPEIISKLQEKKFILMNKESGKWDASETGNRFIRDLVDSYADQKSDNPFLGDEDLTDLADNVYVNEFNLFMSTYPTKTLRPSGRNDYLKEGTKDIKKMYLAVIQSKRSTPEKLQIAVETYVKKKKQTGMQYIKTLKNFLKQEIWKDVLTMVDTDKINPNKDINYGGKII